MNDATDTAPAEGDEALYGLKPAVVRAIVEALEAGNTRRVRRLIAPLHYTDVADLLERLKPETRRAVVDLVSDRMYSEVLVELDEDVREEVIDQIGAEKFARAVTEMDTDDAVEVIEVLDEDVQQEVLDAIPEEERRLLEEGLAYPEDSAGRLMQREMVVVPAFWTVGETIDFMREEQGLPDDFYDIYVIDPAHRPQGRIPLSRLLRTRRPVRVAELMSKDIHEVPAETDQEEVARLFRDLDLVSAPVVDDAGRMIGMITVDDVVDVIDEEAEEDLMRLARVGDEAGVYSAVFRTAQRRFTWLSVNIVTALLASVVIAFFEASIDQMVALAILLPIAASLGGNAATQTLTVAVRALAMRELGRDNAWRYIGKELAVNFIIGLLLAVCVGTVAGLWFEAVDLGAVIAGALVVNLVVAGISGTTVPITLERLGIDPAIASSVFVITLTDVIGFLAFLGFATLFLL